MKKPVLVLLALLSLISFGQSMAQTQPVAVPASKPAAASVSDADAQFLATLSGGQTQTLKDLTPAPTFLTGCTSQCPTGEICCFLCGNPPDGDDSGCWGCITPYRGRCPMVV
jgi:hypothetical protein